MTFNFVLDCVFSIPHKLFTYIVYFNVLDLNVHFVSYTISISKSKSIPTTRTAIYVHRETDRQTDRHSDWERDTPSETCSNKDL